MADQEEIQFASVALAADPMQLDVDTKTHGWSLRARVTFGPWTVVGTELGDIEVAITGANLSVKVDNCSFDPFEIGFEQLEDQTRKERHEEKRVVKTELTRKGGVSGVIEVGLTAIKAKTASSAAASAEGHKLVQAIMTTEYTEDHHLVTFIGSPVDNKVATWRIRSVDGSALIGTVISKNDSEKGRLGKLISDQDGGFDITARIDFLPSAQILTDVATPTRLKDKKLGVIGALLKKEISHASFEPLHIGEFK